MYIYVLNIMLHKNDSIDDNENNFKTRAYVKGESIEFIKDHALEYIEDIVSSTDDEKFDGYFSISTYLISNSTDSVFDKLLHKYDNFIDIFNLSGEFICSYFEIDGDMMLPYIEKDMFDSNYTSKFKPGDIVKYVNPYDEWDNGIYVINTCPQSISVDNLSDIKSFYSICGISNDGGYYYFDSVYGDGFTEVKDLSNIDPDIFVIRDFILGKRTDIENITDPGLYYVLTQHR